MANASMISISSVKPFGQQERGKAKQFDTWEQEHFLLPRLLPETLKCPSLSRKHANVLIIFVICIIKEKLLPRLKLS